MKISMKDLKKIISEELKITKVQTKDQVRREKEAKKRSTDRKRSWNPDTYTLAKGIISEEEVTIPISEETDPAKLILIIKDLQDQKRQMDKRLDEDISHDKLTSICNKKGFRTLRQYLAMVNAISASEKGKLNKD